MDVKDLDKRFEKLRFEKFAARDTILKALDMVRDYFTKAQLIVVGGMAIDFNMRLKGSKLYPDDSLPDYDCYSSDHAADSYKLANQLCAAFPNTDIDVINAIHVTTLRVRILGQVVADITYCPPKIFATIQTQEYKGLRVIHPHYIIMDQLDSLCAPFENPPQEVITDRWSKDFTRLEKLVAMYPFETPPEHKELKTPSFDVKLDLSKDGILCGWPALAWYNSHFPNLEELYITKWSTTMCKIPSKKTIWFTENYHAFLADKTKYFNPLLGFLRRIETDDQIVYDSLGVKLTIEPIGQDQQVASLALLAWYFVQEWLFHRDPIDLLGVMNTMELIHRGKWPLSVKVYGTKLWSASFQYYLKNFVETQRSNMKPPHYRCPPDPLTANIPEFKYDQSEFFQIDGSPSEPFKPLVDEKLATIT